MVLTGIMLGIITMLLGLEAAEWAFVIVFWLGIMLSVPALVAMLLTGIKGRDNDNVAE